MLELRKKLDEYVGEPITTVHDQILSLCQNSGYEVDIKYDSVIEYFNESTSKVSIHIDFLTHRIDRIEVP
jgi:hypothetical protein